MKIRRIRWQLMMGVTLLALASLALGWLVHPAFLWGLVPFGPLVLLGLWDLVQREHSLMRNYPLVGRLRYLLEDVGPELRQYIVEADLEGRPFDRDVRSLIYQRAKNVVDKKPFGTELSVYAAEYAWLAHSMAPVPTAEDPARTFRVDVGGELCARPYSASVFNISAMSFGSLGASAIRALNLGARMGGFAHVTGEGGLSRYHLEKGGDLVWQIGTGYFGCRAADGGFDADVFRERAAHDAVKMIEIKLSQGAKPGHGGILPGAKVTREIAEVRGVPPGVDCISPSFHREFATPLELCAFVARLRELSGSKPIGVKLCVGRPDEFLGFCKAMLETGIRPDFVTVDGGEGGTGAAPVEFSDHVGMPLREGLVFVRNALVGAGLRDDVRIAASGKRVTAFEIAAAMALGADWCNSARGFMIAVGCIQAQVCHTNECPVGVTTQDPVLQRGLVVAEKGPRAYHFHRNTMQALAEVIAAAGLRHPSEITPSHLYQRITPTEIRTFAEIYDFLAPGQLLEGRAGDRLQALWEGARADRFQAP